jgi:hypothetical protein
MLSGFRKFNAGQVKNLDASRSGSLRPAGLGSREWGARTRADCATESIDDAKKVRVDGLDNASADCVGIEQGVSSRSQKGRGAPPDPRFSRIDGRVHEKQALPWPPPSRIPSDRNGWLWREGIVACEDQALDTSSRCGSLSEGAEQL